ncbi:MAG: DUF4397 domain-containing protein [Chitinophagaceae bacterium]
MRYLFISVLLIALISCEKTKLAQKKEIDPAGKALVKVGYFSAYSTRNNFPVQLIIDTLKLGGLFTYGAVQPGGEYYAVEPGTRTIKVSVPFINTKNDSLLLFSGSINLTADARQTIMITDTAAKTEATLLNDDVTPPVGNLTSRAKFFNGIPNVGPVDLYVRTPSGVINPATNIDYKKVSNSFEFPGIGNDTFQIVPAGQPYTGFTSTNVITTTIFITSVFGRNYTVVARGYAGLLVTDTRRAQISLITTR